MGTSLLGKVFKRTDSGIATSAIAKARQLGVATLAATMGEPVGRDQIIARGGLMRISGTGVVAGSAVTVWNPGGNNTMLRFGIESCLAGDILVVTSPADGFAQWGDNASTWAKGLNIAAVIIDGSVRDVANVRKLGVPVWGRTVDPRQALKEAPGYVNAPIHIGSVLIQPGDLVVADDDAVMVLRPDQVEAVVNMAVSRAAQEEETMRQAATGKTPDNLKAIFSGDRIEKLDRIWTEADGLGKV